MIDKITNLRDVRVDVHRVWATVDIRETYFLFFCRTVVVEIYQHDQLRDTCWVRLDTEEFIPDYYLKGAFAAYKAKTPHRGEH